MEGAFKSDDTKGILNVDNLYFRISHLTFCSIRKVPGTAAYECKKVKESEVYDFLHRSNPERTDSDNKALFDFAQAVIDAKNIVAYIESRWCPFDYMRNVSYRRDYWSKEMQPVVDAIRKRGRVECKECINIANDAAGAGAPTYKLFENYINILYSK